MIKEVTRAAVIAALALGASAATGAEAVGLLNDTGQVACYGPSFMAVPCDEDGTGDGSALPRQDARHGRDAAAEMGRLRKKGGGEQGFDLTRLCMNGQAEGERRCPVSPPLPEDPEYPEPEDWACVRDNLSGLTWTVGNLEWATWEEASSTGEGSYIHWANTSRRCGLDSGWRLPARREGFSLMHLEREFPAVDPEYFPLLGTSGSGAAYWTTDVNQYLPLLNWVMAFTQWPGLYSGQCRETVPAPPCGQPPADTGGRWVARVLLVNGEWERMPPPKEGRGDDKRWEIREDGLVVSDTATGLMWDRCTWGQSEADCAGDGEVFYNWVEAMQVASVANQQRHRGYYDWRLPNVRELESLVKIDALSPSIDMAVFPNTSPTPYWTASQKWVVPGMAMLAWNVHFREGAVFEEFKTVDQNAYPDRSRVRLVRGGQQWAAFDGVSEKLYAADFEGAPN